MQEGPVIPAREERLRQNCLIDGSEEKSTLTAVIFVPGLPYADRLT